MLLFFFVVITKNWESSKRERNMKLVCLLALLDGSGMSAEFTKFVWSFWSLFSFEVNMFSEEKKLKILIVLVY